MLLLSLSAPAIGQQSDSDNEFSLNDELLLDLQLEGRSLGLTILGYQRDGEVLLSLSEFAEGVQFPISTDADAGLAGGWFISEEREFALNLAANEVISDGQSLSAGNDVVVFESDIYVTTDALETWFPLVLTPRIRDLALNVEPQEQIPLQARMARGQRRPAGMGSMLREPELPFQETPYRALGSHATDIRLNVSSILEDEEDTSTSMDGSYSVLSRGDLAWMTSTIAISGNNNEDVTNGRLKLERSELDGPLELEYVELGDVDAGARGVQVRGGGAQRGLTGLFADESVDLRGDLPPDWEVELYRNGVLVDVQVVDNDAQYEFLDVPLEFGENRFEFVFYGPFGEERREEQVYFAGRSGLDFGEVSYELAAVQDGRSMFDISPAISRGDRDTGRYIGNFNLGLASNALARFGVESYEFDGERVQDYQGGVSVNFSRFQTNVGYQSRARALDQATGLVRARIGERTNTSLRYTHYLTNGLDEELIADNRQKWGTSATLSTRLWELPLNFDAFHLERELTSTSAANLGTTLAVAQGTRLSKSFFYDRQDVEEGVDERTGGSLSISDSLRPWRFRAGGSYDISPEAELRSVFSSASLRIEPKMTMNFDVRHTPQSDYTTYRAGFNWLLDYVQISPQVIYDSNERWVGLVSLSTSFNPRPGRTLPEINRLSQTGYGAAYARAFLDQDGDGLRGEDEEGLGDVRVDAVQAWRNDETDADGRAYLTRLRRDRVTDIAIDPTSLPDFELEPGSPGVSIRPRPGSWSTVDFPVARTMELEGHAYEIPEAGASRVPARRVLVELVDESGEVVSRQRTVFDGFYLFSGVRPGTYELRLAKDNQRRLSVSPGKVEVRAEGGVIRDLDFVIGAPAQRQLAADIVQPEPDSEIAPRSIAPAVDAPSEIVSVPMPEPKPDTSARSTGNWHVQFGAFGEEENARQSWAQLRETGLLPDDYQPRFEPSGGLIRLLTEPGTTEAQARRLCQRVQEEGAGDCLVRRIND